MLLVAGSADAHAPKPNCGAARGPGVCLWKNWNIEFCGHSPCWSLPTSKNIQIINQRLVVENHRCSVQWWHTVRQHLSCFFVLQQLHHAPDWSYSVGDQWLLLYGTKAQLTWVCPFWTLFWQRAHTCRWQCTLVACRTELAGAFRFRAVFMIQVEIRKKSWGEG